MFNSGIRGRRAKDGEGTVSTQSGFVQKSDPQPTITGYSISGIDDLALDLAGGQTIKVTGSGFATGISGTIGGTQLGAVTFVNSNQVTFTSPAKSAGSHALVLYNSTGGAAILVPGITYSSVPTYTTAAGSIGAVYETKSINTSVVATSDSALTYSLDSGTLPAGATLSSNGTITGTAPTDASSTTYTFAIKATDTELQDVTRTFTLTVNTDVVTWSTPSSGATIVIDDNPYSQTLSATSAAGYNVSYSANALPTGLTLTSGTITGTPTVEGNVSTLLTATASTTNKSATNTITWVVNLSDPYWKSTSLLLNGSTPTTTFINDASLNNNQLTIAGDTKPNNFNPYRNGYYSNYFDGTGDFLSVPYSAQLAEWYNTDYTMEAWVYTANWAVSVNNSSPIAISHGIVNDTTLYWSFGWNSTGYLGFYYFNGAASNLTSATIVSQNTWHHIAFTHANATGTISLYLDGVLVASGTKAGTPQSNSGSTIQIGHAQSTSFSGYISNVRITKGALVYTSAFTPSTTPLTAAAGTNLLTCQSNRLIDNSLKNFAITKNGDTTVSSAHPFTIPTTASYNTMYSAYFDGTGDNLSIPDNSNLQLSSSNFTVEGWFFSTSTGTNNSILNLCANGTTNYISAVYLYVTVLDVLRLQVSENGTTFLTAVDTASTVVGSWNHFAVVRNGQVITLFLNGVSAGTVNTTTAGTALVGGTYHYIGTGRTTTGTARDFQGLISNIRLIKGSALYTTTFTVPTTTLTAVSGTSLLTCQSPTLIDNSTNAFTITSAGDVRPIALSPFTMTTSSITTTSLGSAYFDGTGDYLTLPASASLMLGSGDFTIEAWVYTTIANQAYGSGIIGTYDGGSNSGWSLTINRSTGATYGIVFIHANTIQQSYSTAYLPVNTWHHIAVTRSGTTLRTFLNGVQVATGTYSTADTVSATCYVGSQGAGQYHTGNISDARFVKGTAFYTSNFLPPQAPLTAVTNTILLTCQYNGGANNNGFVDQSSFNNIITRTGNVTQGTFSPYSQTGWSNYFNGSSYLTIPNNTAFDFSTSDFTIECWINPTTFAAGGGGTSDNNYVASALPSTGSITGWYFGYGTTGGVFMGAWVAGTNQSTYTIDTVLTVGRWSHVAFTRTSGVNKIFIDGVSKTLGGTFTQAVNTGGNALHLGAMLYSTYYNYPTAYISNFRIVKGTSLYSSDFTPSTSPLTVPSGTSLLTFQSNRLIDVSSYNHTITATGSPTIQAYSPFGSVRSVPTSYSNYFDGTGDALYSASSTVLSLASSDFTIELWYNTLAKTNSYPVIISNGNFGPSKWQLDDRHSTAGAPTKLIFGVYNAQSTPNWLVSTTAIQNGIWYHVAIVRSGSTFTMYLNGVAESTQTYAGAVDPGTAQTVYIGQDEGQLGTNYNGYVSNVRIVKGQALYTSAFTPSTSPLTNTSQNATASNVSLLTCQSNTIADNSNNYLALTANGDVKPVPFNPFGSTTANKSYSSSTNGGSMYFSNAAANYLTVTNSNLWNTGTTTLPFTVEAWIYPIGITGGSIISAMFVSPKVPYALGIGNAVGTLATSNQVWFGYYNSGWSGVISTGSLTMNQWTHVAGVYNGTTIYLFLNGVMVASSVSTWPAFDAATTAGYIAKRWDGVGGGADGFNGYITDARITKGAALYSSNFYPSSSPATPVVTIGTTSYTSNLLANGTSGGIIDAHGSNNIETVGNAQLAPLSPYASDTTGKSLYFDGTGDYLYAVGNPTWSFSTGDFAIEGWFYQSASQAAQSGIFNFYNGSAYFVLHNNATSYSNLLTVWVDNYSAGLRILTSTTTLTTGQWYHFAITRASGVWKLFVNGTQESTYTNSAEPTPSGSPLRVGYGNNAAFTGYIKDLRITKGYARYTSAFTPPTIPLKNK